LSSLSLNFEANMKLFAIAAVGASARITYDEYKEIFEKYDNGGSEAVFEARMTEIEEHNSGNSRFEMGVNQYTDIEDRSFLFGWDGSSANVTETQVATNLAVAVTADWRSRMPAVKNQLSCGSCWTFSAMAVVDFFNGQSHSEQQVGDCAHGSNDMCAGGNPYNALNYLAQGHKSATTSSYPYTATGPYPQKPGSKTCRAVSSGATVSQAHATSGASTIASLVQKQVVAVGFFLSNRGPFMDYTQGVYDKDCGTGGGHAVAIVGYQSDYWIVRNSWAASWGQKGYFYFKKGKNLCGMEANAWYADVRTAEVVV